jgi:hypothetical protein
LDLNKENMKKLFLGGGILLAVLCTTACERTKNNENETADDDKRVVKRDSVATEYEVTETVVEYDTTKKTKTVKADADADERDDDKGTIKVKKERD